MQQKCVEVDIQAGDNACNILSLQEDCSLTRYSRSHELEHSDHALR